ncbi:hypothetical protein C8F01DRAFT_1137737 [Mycena amicta]|nr:hypothetical protein C8F01DRAFT_1137737 [Mycena amicta]
MNVGSHRVSELWFPDGNIVLQAGDALFKVFLGILAARSPIFHDMMSIPQPHPDASDVIDGCPLVRLADASEETTFFLRAVFDSEFFPPYPARTELKIITGCLKLGHKYQIDYIRRRALVHLASAFPTELAVLDKRHYNSTQLSESDKCSWIEGPTGLPPPLRDIFISIAIAREVDALWVLPAAFYHISCHLSKAEDLTAALYESPMADPSVPTLSPGDRQAFLRGHDVHYRAAINLAGFLSDPAISTRSSGCTGPMKCKAVRLSGIHAAQRFVTGPHAHSAPLHMMVVTGDNSLKEVCKKCLSQLQQGFQDRRQAYWEKLPDSYGLPEWTELKKMQAEALGLDVAAPPTTHDV